MANRPYDDGYGQGRGGFLQPKNVPPRGQIPLPAHRINSMNVPGLRPVPGAADQESPPQRGPPRGLQGMPMQRGVTIAGLPTAMWQQRHRGDTAGSNGSPGSDGTGQAAPRFAMPPSRVPPRIPPGPPQRDVPGPPQRDAPGPPGRDPPAIPSGAPPPLPSQGSPASRGLANRGSGGSAPMWHGDEGRPSVMALTQTLSNQLPGPGVGPGQFGTIRGLPTPGGIPPGPPVRGAPPPPVRGAPPPPVSRSSVMSPPTGIARPDVPPPKRTPVPVPTANFRLPIPSHGPAPPPAIISSSPMKSPMGSMASPPVIGPPSRAPPGVRNVSTAHLPAPEFRTAATSPSLSSLPAPSQLPAPPPQRKAPPPPPVFTVSTPSKGDPNEPQQSLEEVDDQEVDEAEQKLSREQWLSFALRRHPDILELRERLRPLSGTPTFARLKYSEKTEVKETLSPEVLSTLLLQYFNREKFIHAAEALITEASCMKKLVNADQTSGLVALLRMGLKDVEHVFNLEAQRASDDPDRDSEVIANAHKVGAAEDEEEASFPDLGLSDKPVWDELCDGSLNIVFESGDQGDEIKAASINRLIERLTSEKLFDLQYMQMFLATYQSFCKPEKLLQKLLQRYHVPRISEMNETQWRSTMQRPIQLRVCNVLKTWIERHFSDLSEKNVQTLNHFVDVTLSREPANINLAKQLRNTISKKVQAAADGEGQQRNVRPTVLGQNHDGASAPEVKAPKNVFSPDMGLFDIDEEEIARQLCLNDFNLFSNVAPNSLLNKAWKNPKLHRRALSVVTILDREANVKNWVVYCLVKETKAKHRVKTMTRFLKICEFLKLFNNFASLLPIVEALGRPELRSTRDLLERRVLDTFVDLDRLANPEGGYRTYTSLLNSVTLPSVPYLPCYLDQISNIEERDPDIVDGLVNFARRRRIFDVVLDMQTYQTHGYSFLPVIQISDYLERHKTVPEEELLDLGARPLEGN